MESTTSRSVVFTVSCVLATSLFTELTALGQPPSDSQISFEIVQNVEASGDLSYTLRLLTFEQIQEFPNNFAYVAPDGSRLGGTAFLNFSSFADLGDSLFGTWTLEETPVAPLGSPTSTYEFTLSPFTLDDVFNETPIITTPSNGGTVPESFLVAWEYPSGALRPDGGVELNSGFGAVTLTNLPTPNRQTRLDVDLDLLGDEPLTFRSSSRDPLTQFFSAVTAAGGTAPNSYTVESEFRSMSVSTTVTVVPAPNAAALTLLGTAFYVCVGVRRNKAL